MGSGLAFQHPPTAEPARWRWLPWLVVVAGWLAYRNSLDGAFVFDDRPAIIERPEIRRLWPLTGIWGGGSLRPVTDLTFAINYALGGADPRGFHAVNLAIHLACALLLFGLVRRLLRRRGHAASAPVAWAAATLWVVHPLTTQAVTYVVQRAESLMALAYLATLWGVVRSADSAHPRRWHRGAILTCALGMGTKPVMITAPLAALLLDRAVLAGSWRSAWHTRRGLYVGLAATWGVLAWLYAVMPEPAIRTAGLGLARVSPLAYARTQPGVILHYLRLALWPHPLVFDYGRSLAQSWDAVLGPTLGLGGLLAATGFAWRRNAALALPAVLAWLILAPSSSVFPLSDPAFEHRMYLPLAGLILVVVEAGWWSLRRILPASPWRGAMSGMVVLALAAAMGWATARRNLDYRNELAIWQDTVAKHPGNPRAHNNLAFSLTALGQLEAAVSQYEEALRHAPAYPDRETAISHSNLGQILARQGKLDEALTHLLRAVELHPEYAEAHSNLGLVLSQRGQGEEALAHLERALRLQPDAAPIWHNTGVVLTRLGRSAEAAEVYRRALALQPDLFDAAYNLGRELARLDRLAEAIGQFRTALRIDPRSALTYNDLGMLLAMEGRLAEALTAYDEAIHLQPGFALAHYNRGLALAQQGKPVQAEAAFRDALGLAPTLAEASLGLGNALLRQGRLEEAVEHYVRAIRLKPEFPEAHNNLGFALWQLGQTGEAEARISEALRLQPSYHQARHNLAGLLAQPSNPPEPLQH